MREGRWGATAALLAAAVLCCAAAPAAGLTPGQKCEKVATRLLRRCVKSVNTAERNCYTATGAPCPPGEAKIAKALARVAGRVLPNCPDAATLAAGGYGPLMTPQTLVERLHEACLGEPAALAARSFGGPHAAVLGAAGADQRKCLLTAHKAGARAMDLAFKHQSNCVLRERRGRPCNLTATADKVSSNSNEAIAAIIGRCTTPTETLIALDASTFTARAVAQAGCLAATALSDGTPLDLGCGPRPAVVAPPRGVTTQVVFPEAEWGTRCGNGSSYAIQVRLAPAGEPVENVIVYMQGGGVCLFESDCAGVSSGLLTATDNTMPSGGIMSNSAASNPTFANWTKIFLPYCTQDLHIGGGAVSNFPSVTIHRFGGVNVRAALRWLRDVLWAEMDATSAEGYRPDRLRVLFSGGSAGGFGASYNYHYVLDDLRWGHTVAVPDSSLGLDNGSAFGILALGLLMTSDVPPFGWGATELLPSYCFGSTCGAVPLMHAAHAPRLLAVPEQQILNVSNQVDNTQRSTTFFSSSAAWTNAARQAYCATQGLPGVRYFLPAGATSLHGMLQSDTRFTSITSDGVVLRDWLAAAMSDPDNVVDLVEEGTLASSPSINPFACSVD